MSLSFNGMADYPTKKQPKASNQSGKTMGENYGRGPTKAGTTGDSVPNTTASKGKINGGTTVSKPGNADKINFGKRMTKGNNCC